MYKKFWGLNQYGEYWVRLGNFIAVNKLCKYCTKQNKQQKYTHSMCRLKIVIKRICNPQSYYKNLTNKFCS